MEFCVSWEGGAVAEAGHSNLPGTQWGKGVPCWGGAH